MLDADDVKRAGNLAPHLDPKKAIVLLSVLKDGRVSDSDLAAPLELKSANAASYYRKDLEKRGVITGYSTLIDWTKLGYSTEFMISIEGVNMEANFDIEKEIVSLLEEYSKKSGEVLVLPSGNGRVIVSTIATCFGERPAIVIFGHATSEQDAIVYSRYYVAERFTNARTTFSLVKGRSIKNYLIQKEHIEFMRGSFKESKAMKIPLEFKRRFPSLAKKKK